MNVPDITLVKEKLESLREQDLIAEWELPYENLLTRLSAAIFFFNPINGADMKRVWEEFGSYEHFSWRINTEKKLSAMQYRLTFSQEQKEANQALAVESSAASVV